MSDGNVQQRLPELGVSPHGETVTGLNDVAGSSLFDVGTRLHVGNADPAHV